MKTNGKKEKEEVIDVLEEENDDDAEECGQKTFIDSEKVLFSDETNFLQASKMSVSWTLFLILGFPFYTIVAFNVIAGYAQKQSQGDIVSAIIFPVSLLSLVMLGTIVLAFIDWRKYLPSKECTIITDKRIYSAFVMPNGAFKTMELKSSPYNDIQSIMTASDKSGNYLRVIMKPGFIPKDGLESSGTVSAESYGADRKYRVKNAKTAYMHIPDAVKFAQGEKSKAAKLFQEKHRFEGFFASLFALLFIGALGSFCIFFNAQERSNALLKSGRKEYAHKHYDLAERDLRLAYNTVSLLPFMSQYGMASYRYALALEANGKLVEAVPKFKQAIEKCNWSDSESDISWKPAVFRSNIHLAKIYAQRSDDKLAQQYFEQALNTVPLETDIRRVKTFFKDYATYLRQHNQISRAEQIDARAKFSINTAPKSHQRTFHEDTQ